MPKDKDTTAFDWEEFRQKAYPAIKSFFKQKNFSDIDVWKNLSIHHKTSNQVYRTEQWGSKVGGQIMAVSITYHLGQNPEMVGEVFYDKATDMFTYYFQLWGINGEKVSATPAPAPPVKESGGEAGSVGVGGDESILGSDVDLKGNLKGRNNWMNDVRLTDEVPKTLYESYQKALKIFGSSGAGDRKYTRIFLKNGKTVQLRISDHNIHVPTKSEVDYVVPITFNENTFSHQPKNEKFITNLLSEKQIYDYVIKEVSKFGEIDESKTANLFSDAPNIFSHKREIKQAATFKKTTEYRDGTSRTETQFEGAIREGRMTATDAKKIIESAGLEVPKEIAKQSLKEQTPSPIEGEQKESGGEVVAKYRPRIMKIGSRDDLSPRTRSFLSQLNNYPEMYSGFTDYPEGGSNIEGITKSGAAKMGKLKPGVEFSFYNPSTKTESRYYVEGNSEKIITEVEKHLDAVKGFNEANSTSTEESDSVNIAGQHPKRKWYFIYVTPTNKNIPPHRWKEGGLFPAKKEAEPYLRDLKKVKNPDQGNRNFYKEVKVDYMELPAPNETFYVKVKPLREGMDPVYARVVPDVVGEFLAGYVLYTPVNSKKKAGYLTPLQLACLFADQDYDIVFKETALEN